MSPKGFIECQSAGWVLFSDGRRLIFANRGTAYRHVVLYILFLLTVICGLNGIYWIATGQALILGAILTGISAVTASAAQWTWKAHKEDLKTIPLRDQWVLIIDLANRLIEAPHGEVLAPLDAVRFAPKAQIGSSSRALAAFWPGGSTVIYRGNPFAGSWTAARDVLRQKGVDL